ncbi:MAG: hypothetical protein E6I54_09325 [Chloroflexi bacterium]|nr:MAG: hypothetical protein E6I54_09325 [Chloroflexota bacterium]
MRGTALRGTASPGIAWPGTASPGTPSSSTEAAFSRRSLRGPALGRADPLDDLFERSACALQR